MTLCPLTVCALVLPTQTPNRATIMRVWRLPTPGPITPKIFSLRFVPISTFCWSRALLLALILESKRLISSLPKSSSCTWSGRRAIRESSALTVRDPSLFSRHYTYARKGVYWSYLSICCASLTLRATWHLTLRNVGDSVAPDDMALGQASDAWQVRCNSWARERTDAKDAGGPATDRVGHQKQLGHRHQEGACR